jgi:hypothetical protein
VADRDALKMEKPKQSVKKGRYPTPLPRFAMARAERLLPRGERSEAPPDLQQLVTRRSRSPFLDQRPFAQVPRHHLDGP